MLKVAKNETNTTKETTSSNNSSNKIKHHHHNHNHHNNNNNAEDRLSLLVKAAEKVEDAVMLNKPKYMQQIDFNQPNKMSSSNSSSSSSNFTTLSAFVNSATSNSSSLSSASSNASNNTNSSAAEFPVFIGKNGKPTRPFKAYPKEPLSLPIGGGGSPAFNLTPSSTKSALNHEPIFNYNNTNNTPVGSISPPVNHTSSMSPLSSSPSSNSTSPSLNQTNNNQQLLATALSAITTALNPNMNALMSPENLISLITSAIVASTAPPPPPPPQPPQLPVPQHKQPDADPWSSPEAVMSLIKSNSLNANEINSLISDGNINTKNLLNGLLNGTTDLSVSPSTFADNLSAFAYNSNDFCTQYRKRIQQAQERLLHKQVTQQQQLKTEFSAKVKTSEGGVKKRTNPMLDSMALEQQEQLIINKVQSRIINERDREEMSESVDNGGLLGSSLNDSNNGEFMNYPPKKRHRMQQQQQQNQLDASLEHELSVQLGNKDDLDCASSCSSTSSKQNEPVAQANPEKSQQVVSIKQEALTTNSNLKPIKRDVLEQHELDLSASNAQNELLEAKMNKNLVASPSSSSSTSSGIGSANSSASSISSVLSSSPPVSSPSVFNISSKVVTSSARSNGSVSRNSSTDPENENTDAYKERRRKNNEAAKRSRDARRAKEDDIALRAALLERENLQLKVELAQLKQETSRLRCLLYNS